MCCTGRFGMTGGTTFAEALTTMLEDLDDSQTGEQHVFSSVPGTFLTPWKFPPIQRGTVPVGLLNLTSKHGVLAFLLKWWKNFWTSTKKKTVAWMSSQVDSCCELRNKVAVIDSKIVEGLVVALLLLHSSRTYYVFEVHYEIEKGSFFSFQWNTSEFNYAVSHLILS